MHQLQMASDINNFIIGRSETDPLQFDQAVISNFESRLDIAVHEFCKDFKLQISTVKSKMNKVTPISTLL